MTTVVKSNNVINNINKFIYGWYSIFSLCTFLMIVAVVQMLIYLLTDYKINGIASGEEGSWINWIYLTVSIPFGMSAVIGMIYSIRRDPRFIWYSLVIELCYVASAFSAGMMFTGILIPMLSISNVYKYIKIKKEGPNYNINTNIIHTLLIIFIVGVLLLGVISIEFDTNNKFWWNTNVYGDTHFYQYLDVVTGAFTFIGGVLLLTRNKWSFVSYFICDLFYLLLFFNAHQWTSLGVTITFIIIEVLGYIVWHSESEIEKEQQKQ